MDVRDAAAWSALIDALVSAHGNSLRALLMVLERITPEKIMGRELETGAPVIYRLNADGTVASIKDLGAHH